MDKSELFAFQKDSNTRDYNTQILVGNWCELRYAEAADKKCIVPAVVGKSTCVTGNSAYTDTFSKHKPKDLAPEFINCSVSAFLNFQKNSTSKGVIRLNDEYQDNITTTYDVMYRIKPKTSRPISEVVELKDMKVLQDDHDYLKCYGNKTQFGLRELKKCKELVDKFEHFHLTEYKQQYLPKYLPPN